MTPAPRRLAALALCALVLAPVARADGDPASDVLISQPIFFTNTLLPRSSKVELARVVDEANKGGYTVRVALIGDRVDLGLEPQFWLRPQPYASFLSQELLGPAPYTNRVLVVMPNGFGLSRSGQDIPAERRALDGVPSSGARGDDLALAGARAVERLAALRGVTVEASPETGGGNSKWLVVGALALGPIAFAAAAVALLRRRRMG